MDDSVSYTNQILAVESVLILTSLGCWQYHPGCYDNTISETTTCCNHVAVLQDDYNHYTPILTSLACISGQRSCSLQTHYTSVDEEDVE